MITERIWKDVEGGDCGIILGNDLGLYLGGLLNHEAP